MDYYDKKLNNEYYKYTKYKKKYLKLKMNQLGGTIENIHMEEDDFRFSDIPFSDITYETTINKYRTDDGKIFFLVKIKLNDDKDKPVLFGMAGISKNSFKGTATVILKKLDELATKFSELYLLQYASFDKDQNDACSARDEAKTLIKEKTGFVDDQIYKNDDYREDLYTPELEMNSKIADHIHEMIISLGLKNVHLLGKCNGAWVVTLLLLKDDIYKGLYLVVPGIAFGVNKLLDISTDRLGQISFIFGWVIQDAFPFKWGVSNQEKDRYDKMISYIEEEKKITIKYKSYMFDNGKEEDKKLHHEIYPEFIDIIVETI